MTRIRIGQYSEVLVRGSFEEVTDRLAKALEEDESFVEFQRESGSLCWLNPRKISALIRPEEVSVDPGNSIAVAIP